jgi:CDP-glycerol glycerophosphotransferase (TagB/SpsB family)
LDSPDPFPFIELTNPPVLPEIAAEVGIQLAVKPHYKDAAAFQALGVPVLSDNALVGAGVGLYQLLGRASALVTDYSSIWTDFVPLNRPIGLFCPDLMEYEAGRGFSVDDFSEYAPGPVFTTSEGWREFLGAIADGRDLGAVQRTSVSRKLGVVTQLGATDRLMEAILTKSRTGV